MKEKTIQYLLQFLDRIPSDAESLVLAKIADTKSLSQIASQLRDEGHSNLISYSRKIFIPLTKLCRDFCHYCTFAESPKNHIRSFMTPDEVLELVKQGEAAGCKEALFTLGDKPELRYKEAREELASLGHKTTLSYLNEICQKSSFPKPNLLPHINAGVMTAEDLKEIA